MRIKQYMVEVYAVLVRNDKRKIDSIPEAYQVPVSEYLAAQEEDAPATAE